MIRQAEEKDIQDIEAIFTDVVCWMKQKGIPNLWNMDNTRWESLQKEYDISDFYLYVDEGKAVGCMALTDLDLTYWKELAQGEAIFLHKLAIKRIASGKGISGEMITFARIFAKKKGASSLRLDCNTDRMKLRELYEKEGFTFVRNLDLVNKEYQIALYISDVSNPDVFAEKA